MEQINQALRDVDEAITQLVSGLNKRSLLPCVNLLVVADHGMTLAGPERLIQLRDIVPDFGSRVSSLWNGVFARFNAKDGTDGEDDKIYTYFRKRPLRTS